MTAGIARRLRREMTDAERKLWARLRNGQLGVKFRRQMPLDRFIVDFACERAKLVIEVDGSQHGRALEKDSARSKVFEARGYLVLRFWNNEVHEQIDGVMDEIRRMISQRGSAFRAPEDEPPLP